MKKRRLYVRVVGSSRGKTQTSRDLSPQFIHPRGHLARCTESRLTSFFILPALQYLLLELGLLLARPMSLVFQRGCQLLA